jgi:hypothetical protein
VIVSLVPVISAGNFGGIRNVLHIRTSDRRVSRSTFRYPERRSGFDRRHPGGLLRMLRNRPGFLLTLLVGLNVLSAADWALTSRALAHGALEANAIMNSLIAVDPFAAAAFKAACVLAVTTTIWFARRYRLILATAVGAVGVYGALMLYQFAGLLSSGAS